METDAFRELIELTALDEMKSWTSQSNSLMRVIGKAKGAGWRKGTEKTYFIVS